VFTSRTHADLPAQFWGVRGGKVLGKQEKSSWEAVSARVVHCYLVARGGGGGGSQSLGSGKGEREARQRHGKCWRHLALSVARADGQAPRSRVLHRVDGWVVEASYTFLESVNFSPPSHSPRALKKPSASRASGTSVLKSAAFALNPSSSM